MGLAKYTPQEEIKKLEVEIKILEQKNLKGWIARMQRHYQIKKLNRRINELKQL